jgi:lysophospholipase L1-like esterase
LTPALPVGARQGEMVRARPQCVRAQGAYHMNARLLRSRSLRCLPVAMGLALASGACSRDLVRRTDFSTDPASAGWQRAGRGAGWTSASGRLDCRLAGWYSPVFTPPPGEYYRVRYDAQLAGSGKAQFGAFFGNPEADHGLEPGGSPLFRRTATGAPVLSHQLLAGNYTSIEAAGDGWTTVIEFVRAPVDATRGVVYFGPDSAGVFIDNVQVSPASRADVRSWADGIRDNMTMFPVPLTYKPPPDRFAHLPNTVSKLLRRQTLRVVVLGDSIMEDTANSAFDVMIERRFPGSTVEVITAAGHVTGMNDWLNARSLRDSQHDGLDLQQAVYDRHPDLVILGGISNGGPANASATAGIVRALTSQGIEVLLTTGGFGAPVDASTFSAAVDGATTGSDPTLGYRNWLFSLAKDAHVGFLDTHGVWGAYLLDLRKAGMGDDTYYRDRWIHANTAGKNMIGRIYERYFSPSAR